MVTFGIILLVSFFLVVLVLGLSLYSHYRRFRRTPECVWRNHVFETEDRLADKLARRTRESTLFRKKYDLEVARERQLALFDYLATLSVDLLQAYPGIGPATVERLRGAGFATLDRLVNARLALPSLGEKRMKDLHQAVHLLFKDVSSRFDAGAIPEAQKFDLELEVKEAILTRQIEEADRDVVLYRQTLDRLNPYISIARKLTLLGFMKKESVPELTPKILATPLGDYLLLPEPPAPVSAAPIPVPVKSPTPRVDPRPVARNPRGQWVAESAKTAPVIGTAPKPLPTPSIDLFRAAIEAVPSAPVAAKPDHPRLPQLLASVQFAFAVARADGKVAISERKAIRQYLQEAFGYEPALSPRINPLMEQTEKKTPDLDETLAEMRKIFEVAELQKLYRFACDVADAAGKRNAKEISCLKKIAVAWGMNDQPAAKPAPVQVRVPVPVETPKPAPNRPVSNVREQCFAALEIALGTPLSVDLVRRQYRLLTERFDPAKFESQGTDFVTLAKEKREKAERAARVLLEQLGAKLEEEKAPEAPKDLRHNPDLDAVFGN